MRTIRLEDGETLYLEGERSEHVYLIEAGAISVLRTVDGEEIPLAELGRGQILGEMGVLRSEPRSTTTRAVGRTRLLGMPADRFLDAFGKDNPWGVRILRMLCERLAGANAGRAASPRRVGDALVEQIATMCLKPASPAMERRLEPDGIRIDRRSLPFTVGRPGMLGRHADRIPDLMLDAAEGSRLSEVHFAIETGRSGRLVLHDLDSNVGCLVNGRRVSAFERYEDEPVAPLRWGANTVVAGGIWSPFRLSLDVTPRAE
jgi:CRP-like cAMP-binding protein